MKENLLCLQSEIKDLILDILMNNYENRMQEYIGKGLQKAENVVQ